MALQAAGAASNLLNTLFTACLNAKIKHDKIKGMLYCLVGKELDDKVKELFGSLLVDWNDELYNKLRIHSLSLPKLVNIQFTGKTVFVGASGTGKTSIFKRLTDPEMKIPDLDLTSEELNEGRTPVPKNINAGLKATVGTDFKYLNSKEFNLMLWDTAGQDFLENMRLLISQVDFIIIVSDAITPNEENIKYWIQAAEECGKHWIHVSTKYDLVKDIDHYEKHKYKPHFCVSAQTGQGLSELRDFIVLAEFFAHHKQKIEFVDKTVNRTDAPSIFSHCTVL
jgi:GTPase SAR1 family protein